MTLVLTSQHFIDFSILNDICNGYTIHEGMANSGSFTYFKYTKVPQRLDRLEYVVSKLERKFEKLSERFNDIEENMDIYTEKLRELDQLTSLLIILKEGSLESIILMEYLISFFTTISNQMLEKDPGTKNEYSLFSLRNDEKTRKLLSETLDLLGFPTECIDILKLSLQIVHEDDWRKRQRKPLEFEKVKDPEKMYAYLRERHSDVARDIQFTLQKMIATVYFEALFKHIMETSVDDSERATSLGSGEEFAEHFHTSLGNSNNKREEDIMFQDLLTNIKTSLTRMRAQKFFKLK